MQKDIHRKIHPFSPCCSTLSPGPWRLRSHLPACCWGSTRSGQRWLQVRITAFSTDSLSGGRPWLCQAAMLACSASSRIGSRPSVSWMRGWNMRCEERKTHSDAIQINASLILICTDTEVSVKRPQINFTQGGKSLKLVGPEEQINQLE